MTNEPTPTAEPVTVVPVPAQHEVVPVSEAPTGDPAGQVTIINQPEGDANVAPAEAEPATPPAEAK